MDEGGLDLARLHVAVFARSEATRQSPVCLPDRKYEIAIPCFAGTGAKEARDDGSKYDVRPPFYGGFYTIYTIYTVF